MAKTKVSTESKTQPKGIIMTREEVDPTLVTEIENNARTAERARLAALDEMSGPGLEEIIAKAKADGKQPQDIAMECLKITKAKLNSTTVINALKNDAAAAGGVKAGDAPSKKPPTAAERGAKLIAGAFQAQRPRAAVQTNGN
jgi:hypothetical protein